jgi:hypothetical protein
MMKNYFLIIFFCFLGSHFAFAQKKKTKSKDKEVISFVTPRKVYAELGVNLTGAIAAGGFRYADNLNTEDPFFTQLKVVVYRFGIRGGYGGLFYSDKKISNTVGEIQAKNEQMFRLGLDYQIPIDKRWRIYFGGDLIYGKGSGRSDYTNNGILLEETYTSNTFGGGGLYGVQFHVTKRISLQTEGSLYVTYANKDITQTYTSLSGQPSAQASEKKTNYPLGVPRSLFVIFRF